MGILRKATNTATVGKKAAKCFKVLCNHRALNFAKLTYSMFSKAYCILYSMWPEGVKCQRASAVNAIQNWEREMFSTFRMCLFIVAVW